MRPAKMGAMALFDTHFHLESMLAKGIDLDGLPHLEGMDIGCEPGDIDRRQPLISLFPGLHFSIAAGPWCLGAEGADIDALVEAVRRDCLAHNPHFIGEIGIDDYWKYGQKGQMGELMLRQLSLCDELDKPVVIHVRQADEETLSILRAHSNRRRGIIHCFSSTWQEAVRYLDLGYHISLSGTVTYKANEALREVARKLPEDRILLETDSPYLSPVPMRGKTNTPVNIAHTYSLVASLRGLDVARLDSLVRRNYLSIL